MRIRKIAAVGAAAIALSALALPVTTASAQEQGEMTVEKLVLGETDTVDFEFNLACTTTIQPSDAVEPFTLQDGTSETFTEFEMLTEFDEGVVCTIDETAIGIAPNDAWLLVTNSAGDIIEVSDDDVPVGADFAWQFTTTETEDILDYEVLVVNDYTTEGTAAELCAVVEEQVGQLNNLVDSFGDIETLTPEQLTDLWEATTNIFLAGIDVAPPEISESWLNLTVAYIEVGDILSDAGFDIDALTQEDIDQIEAIFDNVDADFTAVGDFLVANCVVPATLESTTTTTVETTPVATTPRYAG